MTEEQVLYEAIMDTEYTDPTEIKPLPCPHCENPVVSCIDLTVEDGRPDFVIGCDSDYGDGCGYMLPGHYASAADAEAAWREQADPTEIIPCPECGEPLTCITPLDSSRYSLVCSDGCDWTTPWLTTRREAREYALAEYAKRKDANEEQARAEYMARQSEPAPEAQPEPTALQRAHAAAELVANHWYTEDNLERMRAHAALASAEALTRIAEVLEIMSKERAQS